MEQKSGASIWKDGWNPFDTGDATAAAQKGGPEMAAKGEPAGDEAVSPQKGTVPPLRPKPRTLQDLKVPETFVAELTLKHCFFIKVFTMVELKDRLKLPPTLVSDILDYLQVEEYLEILQSLCLNRQGPKAGGSAFGI